METLARHDMVSVSVGGGRRPGHLLELWLECECRHHMAPLSPDQAIMVYPGLIFTTLHMASGLQELLV